MCLGHLGYAVTSYRAQGITHIRCQTGGYGGGGFGKAPANAPRGAADGVYLDGHRYMRETVRMFDEIRSKVGFEVELCHDVHERLKPVDAIRLAVDLEPHRLFFLEDAIPLEEGAWLRELRRLHESGLIISERIGNVRRFWPNKESLVYPELSGLVQKTFGIVGVLSMTLAPLRAQLHLAFVSGATAKGQDLPGSAIDLLLVGEEANYGDLLTGLAPAERTLRRKINPNLYTLADYRRRLREGQPFLLQVLQQPKLFVIGDESLLQVLALPDSSLQANDMPSVF